MSARACMTLTLLATFTLNTLAEDAVISSYIPLQEINITLGQNYSHVYPETLILLPADFPADQRDLLFNQLGIKFTDDATGPLDNDLDWENVEVTKGVEAVVYVAALALNLTHIYLPLNTTHTSPSPDTFSLTPTLEEQFIRKRRSFERLAPLQRQKRTLKHHHKGCMTCQMMPQLPVMINVINHGDCGGGCYRPPPPCNQCGGHYQPPPPVYHPPPRPPPVYHQPQQTCNVCQQPRPPPPPPPVNQCDPCSHQPYQSHPSGGSYSSSSSHAESSASSYSWKKK